MVARPFHDTILIGRRYYGIVCQNKGSIISKGIWLNQNPLEYATPLLLLQLSMISITSKLIDLCLKPLGQSTIVSQIIGGIIFGPSVLSHDYLMGRGMFPPRGAMIFHTFATFGLVFFLFTVGLKTDSKMMVRPGRKAITIGITAMFSTFVLTASLSLILKKYISMDASLAKVLPLLAASQSLTPFLNIACLLDELKILNTDLGRLAISSAMFCDVLGISMTILSFSLLQTTRGHTLTAVLSILSSAALVVFIVYVIRPILLNIVKRIPAGKPVGEMYVVFILMSVLVATLFSETIGQHFVLGPLALGLVVPAGPPLGAALASKLDTLVSGLLYPTYLTDSGLKTNIFRINLQSLWIVGFIVLFASLVKIGAVMLIAHYNKIHFREALVLGLMLNARGVCELIVYNLWRGSEILTQQEFTLAVLSVIAVTAIITPLIKALYDPSKQHIPIQRRTIQHAKREAELRILVCIHNQDNVPSIINLLEASNATEKSPIAVIAVLLVELVGRTTPILIPHQPQQTLEKSDPKSYHIINALQHYEFYNEGCATVQSLSCISRYNRMHDDICRVALDENANIVIITFHKNWAIDGTIDSVNRSIRAMNLNVLNRAPCSVGIFIDRGVLRGSLSIISSQSIYNVLVIYIGGADDGEALSYSARMAKHENVTVTVMRFLLFGSDSARERKLDNDLIDEVCYANIGNKGFLYREEVVRDGVGLASSITGFENGYDLFIVGRSHQESPILSGLDAWSECTELGVIGDMLASTDFGSTSSVLVVQQQRCGGKLINHPTKQVVGVNDIDPLLNSKRRHGSSARSTG
ncbi:cation/H(+) antiporter 15-like [Cornus florida]|uniref:cation/H(+) antiporter 15-like n=1 Tax=Cornus florida TaxID=4283 RepID=UPI00289F501A|nr:cation/H(+) antiporter 15-like [Cornus florida]